MEELDMSGVDPLRWAETRRRVKVVEDYLAINNPTDEDKRQQAVLLGLSINQFKALVRAWCLYKTAAKVAGSGAHRKRHRRPSRLAVPAGAKDLADKVISQMGPDGKFASIAAEVARQCSESGICPPSRSTIWNMVMEARKSHSSEDDFTVIGTCKVKLPVLIEDTVIYPSLTLAVQSTDGAILAADCLPKLADWQQAIKGDLSMARPMVIANDLLSDEFVPTEPGVNFITPAAARTKLSRILGRGVGTLELLYKERRAADPARLLATKEDQPLTLKDALSLIDSQIGRHNEERSAKYATSLIKIIR